MQNPPENAFKALVRPDDKAYRKKPSIEGYDASLDAQTIRGTRRFTPFLEEGGLQVFKQDVDPNDD
jgi:hypothetical protein